MTYKNVVDRFFIRCRARAPKSEATSVTIPITEEELEIVVDFCAACLNHPERPASDILNREVEER